MKKAYLVIEDRDDHDLLLDYEKVELHGDEIHDLLVVHFRHGFEPCIVRTGANTGLMIASIDDMERYRYRQPSFTVDREVEPFQMQSESAACTCISLVPNRCHAEDL